MRDSQLTGLAPGTGDIELRYNTTDANGKNLNASAASLCLLIRPLSRASRGGSSSRRQSDAILQRISD